MNRQNRDPGVLILPPRERYCIPSLNQVRFISSGQTLSLVLGSCISTVFVGAGDGYALAANHIVLAKPKRESIIAPTGAVDQIDLILEVFQDHYGVPRGELCCLHLVGAGSPDEGKFRVAENNIEEVSRELEKRSMEALFCDTGSFMCATYSLSDHYLTVFIENRNLNVHLSYMIDLDVLFAHKNGGGLPLFSSALKPHDRGFEELVEKGIIVMVTGERDRRYPSP